MFHICIFFIYLLLFIGQLSDILLLQMDVFNTFIELLRQTGNVTKGQIDINELRQVLPPLHILEIPKNRFNLSFLLSTECMGLYVFWKFLGGLKLFPRLCNMCLSFHLPTVCSAGPSGVNSSTIFSEIEYHHTFTLLLMSLFT